MGALEEFAPAYQFNEVHRIRIRSPRSRIYRSIKEVTAGEITLFRALTWIRRFGRAGPESILEARDAGWGVSCRRSRGLPMTIQVEQRPTWEIVLEGARRLVANGTNVFTRAQLIAHVQKRAPSRERPSIDPIIQGMTDNATGGPPSACGLVFRRVDRGHYILLDNFPPGVEGLPSVPPGLLSPLAPVRPPIRSPKRLRVERRLTTLIEDFDRYVAEYDAHPPFQRRGQYELHRATIDRRRTHPNVLSAIADDELVSLLHETLQRWGIGNRASRLVPLQEFTAAVRGHAEKLAVLDHLSLETLGADTAEVGEQVWRCIEEIPIVKNIARVVPGTKSLHHLLPDLVAPMDRAWTGGFFLWGPSDPQNRRSFLSAWRDLACVAAACRPSRLVGPGWRTSSTKVLDNAVVAYTMR